MPGAPSTTATGPTPPWAGAPPPSTRPAGPAHPHQRSRSGWDHSMGSRQVRRLRNSRDLGPLLPTPPERRVSRHSTLGEPQGEKMHYRSSLILVSCVLAAAVQREDER